MIVANCVRSAPVAVFTTLFPNEAECVVADVAAAAASHRKLSGVPSGGGDNSYDERRYSHVVLATRTSPGAQPVPVAPREAPIERAVVSALAYTSAPPQVQRIEAKASAIVTS